MRSKAIKESRPSDRADIQARLETLRRLCASLEARTAADAPDLAAVNTRLQIEVATLEAMYARAQSARRFGCVPDLPDAVLALKADQVERRLCELSLQVAGYRALPAPDARLGHNQPALTSADEAGAMQALLTFHARDDSYRLRLALARQLTDQGFQPVEWDCDGV